MSKDSLNTFSLEAALQRSLERSRLYKLDPYRDGAPESSRLSDVDLQTRINSQRPFFTLAKEQIESLYRLLAGSGFCVALADAEGYVLYVTGDAEMIEQCKRRRCVPGYRWAERDVGTCAIGLVLEERLPVMLPGERVYTAASRRLTHAAAPIFSTNTDQFLGIIAFCGSSSVANVHTLALLQQAAEAVSTQLQDRGRLRELVTKNQYLRALAESDARGLISVDMAGCIVESTHNAIKILDISGLCEGNALSDILNVPNLAATLRAGSGFSLQEIPLQHTGNTCFVSLDPIHLSTGELAGGLFTLLEKKTLLQLAVHLTGTPAPFTFETIPADSEPLRAALHRARMAASSTAPVLLCGEADSDKILLGQAIHNAAQQRTGPFISLHCKGISPELLYYELFGRAEGVAGASAGGHPGKLELANAGTLFLHDVDAMPSALQASLLQVIQTGEVQRVGSLRTTSVDVRFISSTNRDLQEAAALHEFRADLFYSLSIFHISVPCVQSLSPAPLPLSRAPSALSCPPSSPLTPATSTSLDGMERHAIAAALVRSEGNISHAAKALGISRPTLYRKIEKYKKR